MWNHFWYDQNIRFDYWRTGNKFYVHNIQVIIKEHILLQINEFAEPNGWSVHDVKFEDRDLVVAISKNAMNNHCRLTFWRMEETRCNVKFLNNLPIPKEEDEEDRLCFLWMDDNFVVVFQRGKDSTRIVIVSTKTRTVVENFTVPSGMHMRYEHGRIILRYKSFIR